jgi:Uma2 family endonuclease
METLTLTQSTQLTALPTQDELPCDDGVPMETQRHKFQMDLLMDTLLPWLEQREDGYVGGNMFVYFSAAQIKKQDFKGPDFFAVLGVPKVNDCKTTVDIRRLLQQEIYFSKDVGLKSLGTLFSYKLIGRITSWY